MAADLFISYAWTSDQHRQWVRLLAAQLKAVGYDVLIDADVRYGDSLNGFMRRVVDADHVLMIVDDNYVERADSCPETGVGFENLWLREAHPSRPATWLSILFKDNPNHATPSWLDEHNPKGFSFNHDPAKQDGFPGSEQVEELWRWLEGLPANKDAATPISVLRERSARLERHELRSDPSQWRSPALEGSERFMFQDAPSGTFRWGHGEAESGFRVSGCGSNSIYVYRDPIKAVGVVRDERIPDVALESQLTRGRFVVARTGQRVVLMNQHGVLSLVEILAVRQEINGESYVAPYVDIRWRVVGSS
jgi:hypothetical protein